MKHIFNWKIYKNLNLDLFRYGLKSKIQFINHYILYSKKTVRQFQKPINPPIKKPIQTTKTPIKTTKTPIKTTKTPIKKTIKTIKRPIKTTKTPIKKSIKTPKKPIKNNINPKTIKTPIKPAKKHTKIQIHENTICTSISSPFFDKYCAKYINAKFIPYTKNKSMLFNTIINNIIDIKNKNIIFFGLYSPHIWSNPNGYNDLINVANYVIIYFIGSDIFQLINLNIKLKNQIIKFIKTSKKIHIICENETSKSILFNQLTLNADIVPMPIKNYNILTNSIHFPTDTLHIGIYMTSNKTFYNYSLLIQIINNCPQYKFYLYSNGGFKKLANETFPQNVICYEEETPINIIYNNINCGIRIVKTDGEPQSGIELMMLGKHFIYNKQMKHAIFVNDDNYYENIINILHNLNKSIKPNNESIEYYKKRNSIEEFKNNISNILLNK